MGSLNRCSRTNCVAIPSSWSNPSRLIRCCKFCLFFYGGNISGIGDALQFGCVPVVITERPILGLPFMDVLRWSEIAVFVGAGGGVEGMKKQLDNTCKGDRYENLAMVATGESAFCLEFVPAAEQCVPHGHASSAVAETAYD
uniref:Exostosin GT47 domain-containing protein n=1 Tax=Nelumbo nucifera TaxID=4432 RepID=A0A822YWR3_NELNU|nr:TPA_asm: hypothetical protein HUJ06_007601 [Nelumbo nucifera]